jgi:hypothetical protein
MLGELHTLLRRQANLHFDRAAWCNAARSLKRCAAYLLALIHNTDSIHIINPKQNICAMQGNRRGRPFAARALESLSKPIIGGPDR